jgi:threonine dehydratase
VATHSSGNHALCLSYAAMRRGIPCNVVMPRTAPQAKKDAVIGYGGVITECEPSTSSREAVFAEVQARTGADFVHPYNDPRVIAGQGTCSRELMEQVEGLEAVVAPIGGGGMISGTCLTLSDLAPDDQGLSRPSRSRPTTPIAASRPATSSPTTRPRPSPTG